MNVFVSESKSGLYLVGEPYRYKEPGIKTPAPWGIQFIKEFKKVWLTMIGGLPEVQMKWVGVFRPKTEAQAEFVRNHNLFKAGLIKEMSEAQLKEEKKRFSAETLSQLMKPIGHNLPEAPSEPELVSVGAVKVPKKGK